MRESEEIALNQAVSGDPEGFRVLVERYSHSVFRLAYRITGTSSDAEDVVQETFLKAYRAIATFDGRASFGTWIYRIASNTALDLVAARKRRGYSVTRPQDDEDDRPFEIPSGSPGPDRIAASGQIQERVHAALAQLTPQERTAFVLRHFEDCSIEEISQTLGVGVSATKNTVFRAVKKLRRVLAPLVESEA